MPKTPRREIKQIGLTLKNDDYKLWKDFADKQSIAIGRMIKNAVNDKINSIKEM